MFNFMRSEERTSTQIFEQQNQEQSLDCQSATQERDTTSAEESKDLSKLPFATFTQWAVYILTTLVHLVAYLLIIFTYSAVALMAAYFAIETANLWLIYIAILLVAATKPTILKILFNFIKANLPSGTTDQGND